MKNKKNQITVLIMTLLMMLMMTSAVFATNWTDHERISVQTGEPVYVVWDSSTSTTGSIVAVNSSYYPSTFVFWVGDGNAPVVSNGSATYLYETQTELDSNTTVTNKAYKISLNGAGTITVTLDNNNVYTLDNDAPQGSAPTATLPTGFNGYLPLGQFATGAGWGSIHTNGTNLTGSTKKFLSGYSSPGISLGAAGGFTDYSIYADNSSTHPYGVDFIVYGNAFVNNPEAGAVRVYGYKTATAETGAWYTLAGSLYYASNSLNNKDVSWKIVVSSNDNDKGIWYKVTNANTAPGTTGWTRFTKNYAWWPFANSSGTISDGKGYGSINGMESGTAFSNTDVSVNADRTQLTYKKVSLVKDTDDTGDYQFGYFDVHENGANYGTAINPYSATASSVGGDGFDLSWAVDSNGNPVVLDHITKVRVYTCAAMNSDGTAFTVPSIFGETSAEVDGIYGVNGSSGSAASITPVVKVSNTEVAAPHMGNKSYNGSTFEVTSSASNLYINGEKETSPYSDTIEAGTTKTYQIISQNGSESPYITVVRVTNPSSK